MLSGLLDRLESYVLYYKVCFCIDSPRSCLPVKDVQCLKNDDGSRLCLSHMECHNFFASLKHALKKGGFIMAGEKKSKTDVAARAENKNKGNFCCNCGKKVYVVLAVSPNGKKRMRRICCEG